MLFSSIIASALLATGALAQYDYGSGSGSSSSATAAAAVVTGSTDASTATPSGTVSVQVVKVSDNNGTLRFSPDDIKAAAGTMIQFHFYPKNHSVVQSAFSNPCEKINNVMPNVTGFNSGFMPVAAGATEMPVFTLMVNDTKPIWFYCSQTSHCQKGMVGAINAPGNGKDIDSFRALAEGSSNSTSTATTAASGSSATSGSTAVNSAASGSGSATTSAPAQQTTSGGARIVGSSSLAALAIAAFVYLL